MAGTAVNGAVATAEGGTASGVSADFVEFPVGADRLLGQRATVFEDTGSSPTAATSDAVTTKSAGTKEVGTRGSGRKLTRLRSAAHSFASGVIRMHSRIRAGTTGSSSAAAAHQTAPTSAEMTGPFPLSPSGGATNTATPSVSLENSVSGHGSAGDGGASERSSSDTSHKASPGGANHVTLSPEHHHLDKVEEGEEAEGEQQQQQNHADSDPSPAAASGDRTTIPDGELLHKEHGTGDNASPATTATRASVMSTDLGGFYRKLLGEDWQEQLKELNPDTNPLLAFEEGENIDANVAIAAGAGGGSIGGGAGATAAAPGSDLQLPDTYQGKMRQRIRRRDISDKPRDISDQVADDLHFGQDEEPLITPEDIAILREEAWIPAGEGVPHLSEMNLGYHRAWDIGKKGCLAVKVDGLWDSAVKANKMRFFVMDGTDPESFLSFYSKSDLHAARGLQSERLGTLTAWDMRDGYWNYPKKKVFVKRSDVKKKKDCILEGFTAEFYDAMLLCIWEMCVQAATEQLKYQRRRERARRKQSLPIGLSPPSGERRRSPTPSGDTRRVSAALLSYKTLPRGVGIVGVDGTTSQSTTKAQEDKVAAQHKEVVRQLIREGRALLARPITSRHARAAEKGAGGKSVNMRLPSRRRKAAPDGGVRSQPEELDTQAYATSTTQDASHERRRQAPRTVAVAAAQGQLTAATAAGKIIAIRNPSERRAEDRGEKKNGASYRVSFQEAEAAHSGSPEAERLNAVTAVAAVTVKGRPGGAARAPHGGLGEHEKHEDDNDEMFSSPLGERTIEDNFEPAGALLGNGTKTAADGPRGQRDATEQPDRSHVSTPGGTNMKEQFSNGQCDTPPRETTQQRADRAVVPSDAATGRAEGRQEGADNSGTKAGVREVGGGDKNVDDNVGRKEQTGEHVHFRKELKAGIANAGMEEKSARQLLDSSEAAATFLTGGEKETGGLAVNKGEQQGQVLGDAKMGERRTVHVVSRQAKIRSGGPPEEEMFDWGMHENTTSDTGGLVERRRRSESSSAGENQQRTTALGGGAAAAFGRFFPWKKLGGAAANTKDEESDTQGEEKGAGAVSAGRGESESAAEKLTAARARAGRERESEAAFRGAIQEIMVADGVQWKPSKATGGGRRSSEWSLAPETLGRRATGKLPKHEPLNRLRHAEPHGAETPLLTPQSLSPRDSEAGKPMFG